MVEKKLFENVTIRLDRTQFPPTPHSIRPKEEERLRIFRSVIELFQVGGIPVSYAYSVPEQSAILAFMRREEEQGEMHDHRPDRRMSREDRIRQLLEELSTLKRDPESLRIDSRGYLEDGGIVLRNAPLAEWYEAMEALGRNAIPESNDGAEYYFSPIVSIDGEDFKIPALTLEDFRDRINRIHQGQWPSAVVKDNEGGSDRVKSGSDGNTTSSGSSEDTEGGNPQSVGEDDEHESKTIRLAKLILVAKGKDGRYYHVPDSIKSSMLPAKFEVSPKCPRMGSIYDMTEVKITSITEELKFRDWETGSEEEG